jgi:hypothetical protein
MAKLVVGINDLQTTHPDLSSQAVGWDPKTTSAGSKKKQKWACSLSHEWHAEIKSRTRQKSGCPVCFGRVAFPGFNDLKTKYPEIANQAIGWDPSFVTVGSHKKLKWICIFNHQWEASPNHRTTRGDGCPECAISGFKSDLNGYLYLMFNDSLQMFKVGITNSPARRLHEHEILGWEPVDIIGPKNGGAIRAMESSILKALKSKNVDVPSKNITKFSGYTETWLKSDYPVKSLSELISITK